MHTYICVSEITKPRRKNESLHVYMEKSGWREKVKKECKGQEIQLYHKEKKIGSMYRQEISIPIVSLDIGYSGNLFSTKHCFPDTWQTSDAVQFSH